MPTSPNRHIEEYLDYYVDMPPPGFAVMRNGPWGIGKTTLIKKLLWHRFPPPGDESEALTKPRFIYVSLFGIGTVEGLTKATLDAAYPEIAGRTASIIRGIGAGLAKKFLGDSGLSAADLLNSPESALFVFDDLERCELSMNAVLGYINTFVEHAHRKVLLIANEQEIVDSDYARKREKLVGQTLQVEPMVDEALSSFVNDLRDPITKDFLLGKSDQVKAVFAESQSHNLRILQQSIWVFERLYSAIQPEHRKNDAAMTALLKIMLAISTELKMDRLEVDELVDRESQIVRQFSRAYKDQEPSRMDLVHDRYPDIDFDEGILTDEVLRDIFQKGIFDAPKITSALQRSSYFVTSAAEPPWRTLWHAHDRGDDVVETAIGKLESQFSNREIAVTGEILHVFGLRLWLSDAKLLQKTRAEIVNEGKRYIDDLYKAKRLEALPVVPTFNDLDTGYDGLGFHQGDTADFRELATYLNETRGKARSDSLPDVGKQLLTEMESALDVFVRNLCVVHSEQSLYARVAVLQTITPATFVDTLLKQTVPNQRRIFSVFSQRYKWGVLSNELSDERPWLISVRNDLRERLKELPPVARHRLQNFIAHSIDRILAESQRAESDEER